MDTMKNTIIYLIGFPGVGKLTIAKEICKKTNAILVDHHTITNPIRCLNIDFRSKRRTEYMEQIRGIVFNAMVELSQKDDNFILTDVLCDGNEGFNLAEVMANKRQATLVPVIISCDIKENIKRAKNEERKASHKTTDDSIVELCHSVGIASISHQNKLDLDISNLSAEQASYKILEHAKNINLNN
jgi:shikimate kinase